MGLKNEGTSFSAQVINVNKLSSYIKLVFEKAGIDCSNLSKSNHSGKVSCLTTLYNSGFDDSAVKSRGDHLSNAVETTKRQSIEMSRNIINAFTNSSPSRFWWQGKYIYKYQWIMFGSDGPKNKVQQWRKRIAHSCTQERKVFESCLLRWQSNVIWHVKYI